MKNYSRYLTQTVYQLSLKRKKMAYISVPRQSGKTTFAEDLSVSPETIKRWIIYLGELYYLYPIQPYSKNIKRSLKKEPKIYLFDPNFEISFMFLTFNFV